MEEDMVNRALTPQIGVEVAGRFHETMENYLNQTEVRGIFREMGEEDTRPTLQNLSIEMIQTAISDMLYSRDEERRRARRFWRSEEGFGGIEEKAKQDDDQIIF